MKVRGLLIAALILLSGFLIYAPPHAKAVSSPSVDANSTFGVFGATTSCSAAVTTIATNDLLVFFTSSREHTGTSTVPHGETVSDSHSLTWQNRLNASQLVSTTGMGISEWWAIAGAAQAYTVSMTGVNDAQDGECQAVAVTGYYSTTPFDPNAASSGKGLSASAVTSLGNTAISTSNPNDLLLSWLAGPACTPTQPTGFSAVGVCQADNGFASAGGMKQVSALQSSVVVSWSWSVASAAMTEVDSIEPNSATVTLPFSCVLNAQGIALGATPPTVTFSGALVSPTTGTCNGTTNVAIQASTGFTASEPADGTNTRFRFLNGTMATITACATGTCGTFQVTNWYQCQTTLKANDLGIQPWGTFTFGTFKVTGTRQGSSVTLTTFNPSHGTFTPVSSSPFMDCGTTYNFPVSVTDQSNNIWYAQEPTALLDISGGGTRTIGYLTNLPVSGGAGAGPLAPGQTSNIGLFTGTDPISQFLNTLVSILSSNIVFYPLLLLFLILVVYIAVKGRQGSGR